VEVMAGEKLIRASDARKAILNIDPKYAYCIDSVPAVDAAPVVHGRWIDTSPNYRNGYYNNAHKCSNCGDYYTTDPNDLYYCPRCGAKMDLEVKNYG
jgi:DNA-directed RNA polymerase subunit RPC12/RpoP